MKNVAIAYFAIFKEQAGCGEESISTTVATVGDLFDEVSDQRGIQRLENMKVAVNDEIVEWSTVIADGDRVFFFPPVSGG